MKLTLYKVNDSPPARAAMMVLEKLGLPVKYIDVDFANNQHHTKEYLKLNPQHTVPVLIDDDFVIWDSHAIVAYLVTKYAPDDSLYPKDPRKRARVDQRLHFDSGILFPAMNNAVGPLFFAGATSISEKQYEDMLVGYQFLNTFLEGKTYLAEEQLTIADICAVATVDTLNALLPVDEKKFPNVAKWMKKLSAEDFYVRKNLPGVLEFVELMKTKLA